MANSEHDLRAGFTGTPAEKSDGIKGKAIAAADAVKREGNAVVTGATDHPHTASTLVVGIGALVFGLGFLLGRHSVERNDSRFWW